MEITKEEYRGYYISSWDSPEEAERIATAEIFRFARMMKEKWKEGDK